MHCSRTSFTGSILLTTFAGIAILIYFSARHPSRAAAQGTAGPPVMVLINGVDVAGIRACKGLKEESEVVEIKDGEDGTVHYRPGGVKPPHITITRDWSNTPDWYRWRQAVLNGKVERKSISVIFHNDAGEETARFSAYNCWPTVYGGPDFDPGPGPHAVESLTLVYERFEFK